MPILYRTFNNVLIDAETILGKDECSNTWTPGKRGKELTQRTKYLAANISNDVTTDSGEIFVSFCGRRNTCNEVGSFSVKFLEVMPEKNTYLRITLL
ncbi:hypothetical protein NPIL_241961 [Nephila pilipes]|uniref:Uncharacterized protein n=1 Tax=Nephila pilipes TaxID=299642 RepID=A0A8X6U1U0_NEPPI|nr:hypothetical protein NPIL_647931 [Nephila pilipes]GFU17615.1 hypothetical protein NPIL_241961 [Nephila pilipes]